jgi:hypothetical protein
MVYDLRVLDIIQVVPKIPHGSNGGPALFDFVPQEPLKIWQNRESLVGFALSARKVTHETEKVVRNKALDL